MEATLRDILANVENQLSRKQNELIIANGLLKTRYTEELNLSMVESHLIGIY